MKITQLFRKLFSRPTPITLPTEVGEVGHVLHVQKDGTAKWIFPIPLTPRYCIMDEMSGIPRTTGFGSYATREDAQAFLASLYRNVPTLRPGYVVRPEND